jgi:hypothetical protein
MFAWRYENSLYIRLTQTESNGEGPFYISKVTCKIKMTK